MAEVTNAVRRAHGLTADLVPQPVLKSIPQSELLDRLVHVAELDRQARQVRDPVIKRGYHEVRRAELRAQPRAVTERQVAALIVKAAATPNTRQADAIRREAQELLAAHPPAPRREDRADITKAKAAAQASGLDHLVLIYDPAGQPVGFCDPAAIQPVEVKTAHEVSSDLETADMAAATVGKARARRTPGRR